MISVRDFQHLIFNLLLYLGDIVGDCENVVQLGQQEQKLCSEAEDEGAIKFHQSGWSLQPFPLSALPPVLEDDNQGGGELLVAGSGT